MTPAFLNRLLNFLPGRLLDERGAIGDVDPPADGGSGGAGAGAGAGGDGGGSGGGPTPITLSDDTLFIPPGGKDPVSWKDYQAGFKPAKEYDALNQRFQSLSKAEDLIRRAEQIDQARRSGVRQGHQPQGQGQGQGQLQGSTVDQIIASVKDKPFITGSDIAQLAQDLQRSNDPTRLYQWANTMNQVVKALTDRFQSVDQRVGGFEGEKFNQQIASVIDSGVTAVELPLDSPELKGDASSALRALAEDFYYGFEPGQGQTRAQYNEEFPKRFAEHFASLQKAFRAVDKAQARRSQEQMRFPGRGGSASATGSAPNRRVSPRERARMFSRHSQDSMAEAS